MKVIKVIRIRDATVGIVVALVASFGYSLFWCAGMTGVRLQSLALAAYFVRITLWFVLPAGAVLGVYLPPSVARLDRKTASRKGFWQGAAAGVICGVLWAAQLSFGIRSAEMMAWWALLFGGTMGIYSACWAGLAARRYSDQNSNNGSRKWNDNDR